MEDVLKQENIPPIIYFNHTTAIYTKLHPRVEILNSVCIARQMQQLHYDL